MHVRAKQALPLLLGGMEREYALIYPLPAGEDEEFAWGLTDYLTYDLERVLSARGRWVRYLVSTRSGLAKYVLHDGGCLAIEDLNVLEISTPEAYDALACLAYLDEYGRLLSRVAGACSEAPEGLIVTDGPAELWTCPVSVDTSTCGGGHLRRLPLFGEHSFILRRALVVKG